MFCVFCRWLSPAATTPIAIDVTQIYDHHREKSEFCRDPEIFCTAYTLSKARGWPAMAVINPVINPVMSPVVYNPTVKDSRWLTLDVCREYTRNKCTRTEDECRFAHPPPNVEVQNGRVMCCFDSIKVGQTRLALTCNFTYLLSI